MKRFVSCILLFALLISITGGALAYAPAIETPSEAQKLLKENLGDRYLQPELVENVESDLSILKTKLPPGNLSIEKIDAYGDLLYKRENPSGIVSYFKVAEFENGNIQLDCFESDKHDQLLYTPDGKLFLDGFEIVYEVVEEDTATVTSQSSITPFAAGFENTYGLRPNTTIPSDYYDMNITTSAHTISFGKKLILMTGSGVGAILLNGMANILTGAAFLAGGWNTALAFVLGAACGNVGDTLVNHMANLGKEYADSTAASLQGRKYMLKNSSFAPRYIYQFTYYAQKDFYGASTVKCVNHEQDPR